MAKGMSIAERNAFLNIMQNLTSAVDILKGVVARDDAQLAKRIDGALITVQTKLDVFR